MSLFAAKLLTGETCACDFNPVVCVQLPNACAVSICLRVNQHSERRFRVIVHLKSKGVRARVFKSMFKSKDGNQKMDSPVSNRPSAMSRSNT